MDAGTVVVRLVTDASGAVAGFAAGAGAAQSFVSKVSRIGAVLTRSVTLPIAAIGVASVAMAIDFDTSMTKIQALVGASAKQMASYRAAVMTMAKETGRAPKELAEALYFVTSSGFKGAAALRVLNASARASAAGLGETKVIADAVTSAISAYGEKNLSAAKATDIMLAAVREGKNEPAELAGSIGRVIPVAQAMGVSFGEVAGTIAALSLNGTDANEAVTQITASLSQAIKPTQQGAKALATIGMDYAKLRDEIKTKGLIDVFNELKQAFGGNIEKIGEVFGNIRALRGVMTLTGVSAQKYAAIIREVTAAQGDTNKAFGIAAQSPAFKLRQNLAKLSVAAIDIGNKLTPAVLRIASALGTAADAFSRLGTTGQNVVMVLAGIAALAGPLLRVGAALATIKLGLTGIAAAGTGAAIATGAASGGVRWSPAFIGGVRGLVAGAGGAGAAGGAAAATGGATALAGIIGSAAAVAAVAAVPVAVALIGQKISPPAKEPPGTPPSPARAPSPYAFREGKAVAVARAAAAPLIQSLTIQAQDATGPAFGKIVNRIAAIKALADKGITPKLDPTKPLASLQEMQASLVKTGMTGKEAFAVLQDAFGTETVDKFKGALLGIGPAGSKAAGQARAKVQQLGDKLREVGGMHVKPKISVNNNAALAGIGAVAGALMRLDGKSATVTTYYRDVHSSSGRVPVKPHSGGVFSGPHSGYPAILHGPEAVLPLEHPNLIPGILAKAGALMGGSRASSTPATSPASAVYQFSGDIVIEGYDRDPQDIVDELERRARRRER